MPAGDAGGDRAAVLVEPFHRCVSPAPGFLEGLRETTRKHGVVLVFDEVVSAAGETAQVPGVGPSAQLAFTARPVVDQTSWLASDRKRGRAMMLELLRRRVFLNSMGTKLYLSLAHETAVIRRFGERLAEALVATSPLTHA